MGNKPAVTLTIAGDADKLSRATRDATKSVDDMAEKTTKQSSAMADASEKHSGRISAATGVAAGFIGAAAIAGGKHLFDLSKSMEALDAKAKIVFQDQLPGIQAWAEENRKAFGESTRNVVGMAANLADLLKPMGFTAAQAADMSKKLLDLSGALSRWSGGTKSAAEVSELLADAMLGETDGLKALGISISAAEVDAKALSMGLAKGSVDMLKVKDAQLAVTEAQTKLNKSIKDHGQGSAEAARASITLEKAQRQVEDAMAGSKGEISDQAKALATQQLILEKSTDAQTAWAEGGKAAAEQQNGLSSTMAESAEKLATVVAPAFERLVSLLAGAAEWMSRNQGLALVLAGLAAAIWLVNIAMNANPMILLATLVLALVAAFTVLWTQSTGFRDFFIGMWHGIQNVVGAVVGWIIDRWNGAVDWFSKLPERIGHALGSLGSIIGDAFKGAINIAIGVLNWGINKINDLIYATNLINPFEDIPPIPHIPRLHTGGVFHSGSASGQGMAMLKDGERISAPGQGGAIELRATGSGAVVELLNALINDGALEARFR